MVLQRRQHLTLCFAVFFDGVSNVVDVLAIIKLNLFVCGLILLNFILKLIYFVFHFCNLEECLVFHGRESFESPDMFCCADIKGGEVFNHNSLLV